MKLKENKFDFYICVMTIDHFIEQFRICLIEPYIHLTPETQFRTLEEWNSMFALIVIAMVDSEYQKELSADDIRSSKTLGDLFTILNNK